MDYSYQNHSMSYKDFFAKVIKWLVIGLSLTTITSIILSLLNIKGTFTFLYFPIMIVSSIVEIIMVIVLAKKINNLSMQSAKKYFYAYSIINGITMSMLLSLVAPGIAILAFALTCAYFGLLYTVSTHTTTDFSNIGKVCLSALPILIIGYIILFFIHAPMLYYGIIILDLILFTGITLYDMKKIKIGYQEASEEQLEGMAMMCALNLYLDFVNIFIDILSLISDFN